MSCEYNLAGVLDLNLLATSKAALEGERKQVTVLSADLKGSMELLADRDPEEVRQLLDPMLERMMSAVHRNEGAVNQVAGDGIMALFGAPIAHEDHTIQACSATLAMQGTVPQYASEVQRSRSLPIPIWVGLNSGAMAEDASSGPEGTAPASREPPNNGRDAAAGQAVRSGQHCAS